DYQRNTNRKPIIEEMLQETRRRRDAASSFRSIARDLEMDESSLIARLKKG
ncbi:hypothetical protein HHI36_014230, partial [Cryptolaemus montrouzieri]